MFELIIYFLQKKKERERERRGKKVIKLLVCVSFYVFAYLFGLCHIQLYHMHIPKLFWNFLNPHLHSTNLMIFLNFGLISTGISDSLSCMCTQIYLFSFLENRERVRVKKSFFYSKRISDGQRQSYANFIRVVFREAISCDPFFFLLIITFFFIIFSYLRINPKN